MAVWNENLRRFLHRCLLVIKNLVRCGDVNLGAVYYFRKSDRATPLFTFVQHRYKSNRPHAPKTSSRSCTSQGRVHSLNFDHGVYKHKIARNVFETPQIRRDYERQLKYIIRIVLIWTLFRILGFKKGQRTTVKNKLSRHFRRSLICNHLEYRPRKH